MIKKIGVKNFCSFKEWVEIDFCFDGNVPESVRMGRDFTTVLGVKGANGSGKTNIIKAFSFLSDFCWNSAGRDNAAEIGIDSYFNSLESTEFYIDFEQEGVSYRYETEITDEKVIRETLFKTTKRKTKILERLQDRIVFTSSSLKELKSIKPKRNASIISIVGTYNFNTPMKDLKLVYLQFERISTNVNYLGMHDVYFSNEVISKKYNENSKLFDFVKEIIISADEGIEDIQIHKRSDEDGKERLFPIFIHRHGDERKYLTIHAECSGTKALYRRMYLYWLVLTDGGVLALDEFDMHIHAMILPKIVDLFLSDNTNSHGSQFIFTAHNTEIIDKLGKYRTILVNKEDNESYCYRLDEIQGNIIRNDRSIVPLYLQGKIGGVPQ